MPSLPRIRRRTAVSPSGVRGAERRPLELEAGGLTWVHLDGPSLETVNELALRFGWHELDPTNNVHVGTDHIALAWGRDFGDVSPLRGVILGGGTHNLSVSVTVEPR